MENPIKMDDLGGPPLYLETPTYLWNHIQPLEDHPGVCVGGPGLFRVICLSGYDYNQQRIDAVKRSFTKGKPTPKWANILTWNLFGEI